MRVTSVADLPVHMRSQAEQQLRTYGSKPPATAAAQPPSNTTPAKRSKYGNVKVHLEGEVFDSQLEYDCYCWIRLRKQAGEVAWFLRQVPFRLEGGVVYRADYLVALNDSVAPVSLTGGCSAVEVWDAKGRDTQASINKRKQVLARYGVEVRLWTKQDAKGLR